MQSARLAMKWVAGEWMTRKLFRSCIGLVGLPSLPVI